MKKIISISIISLFLLASLTTVSAFNQEETETIGDQSRILNLTNYDADISLNEVINFEISSSNCNSEPSSFNNYKIYTRPFEDDISYQKEGDSLIGEFSTTREGIYSLIVENNGLNNNIEKTIFYYIVNPSKLGKVRYYLRDVNPTHGQPGTIGGYDGDHGDKKALLLTPPTKEEYWTCNYWIQNAPDQIPDDMPFFSILRFIDANFWYKMNDYAANYIGVKRNEMYITSLEKVDRLLTLELEEDYTWTNKVFLGVNWIMNSPNSWYRLSLKLVGGNPYWMTKPGQPSYVDFYYRYSNTPLIKSNSNNDITILSATSPIGDSNNAEIVLEGAGTTDLIIQMPDTSKVYSAKLNNVEYDFTQNYGELVFTLNLDSKHAEHILNIYPSQSISQNKQFTKLFISKIMPSLITVKNSKSEILILPKQLITNKLNSQLKATIPTTIQIKPAITQKITPQTKLMQTPTIQITPVVLQKLMLNTN